ncbi:SPFH domain-containing protein [Zavarzinia sp. CC-PAN008]|uniref:SPFH domain-containing protein n=1 Tax=Zavarzinia sp. CC-PAN008 TaxID=3243332 RepID=UPI003F7429B8
MALWDKIRGEFIDVIQWTDDSNDTMVWRFERHGNEIKFGAKLTVREGQVAVFINEGQLADVFEPGMYTLETKNVPILSTLQGWKYGFESPFKAEVYFISTRRFTDLKWGTKNPVMLRDPEFGPVRLRAFGTYAIRVKDAAAFIRGVVGTDGHFTTDEITEQLRNLIVAAFSNQIGKAGIPVLDLAANYDALSKFVTDHIGDDFDQYGLKLDKLLVENVSLPPEVEAAMDRRTSMGIVGDLNKYTQFQTAEALRAAAEAGGSAATVVGLGLGNAMGAAIQQPAPAAAPPPMAPPPLPQAAPIYAAIGGQQAGPFTVPELQAQVMAGKVTRETLVWRQGLAAWTPAKDVADIQGAFAAMPPPLPPG